MHVQKKIKTVLNKKTEEEVLWDVAENLIGRMTYVDCIIYMWNDDKTKMVQKAAYGPNLPEMIFVKDAEMKARYKGKQPTPWFQSSTSKKKEQY